MLAAFLSTMEPVPRWMASLKVTTMLAPTRTAVAPSVGLKVETMGAVVSTMAEKLPSEKLKYSTPLTVSIPSRCAVLSVMVNV